VVVGTCLKNNVYEQQMSFLEIHIEDHFLKTFVPINLGFHYFVIFFKCPFTISWLIIG